MKRILCIFLGIAMMLGLFGCGEAQTASNSSVEGSSKTDSTVSVDSISSESEPCESSNESTSSEEDLTVDDWRTHPEDFKLIALTYDDAPSFSSATNNSTVRIIDAIAKYQGRGTLFVVGHTLAKNGSALLKYAVDKGFELGNHTHSHLSVSTSEVGKQWTTAENYEDFLKCQELVKNEMGITMKYLRPAGVHTNTALYEAAELLTLPCISGNCKRAVSDYASETTADMIVERVLDNAFDGAIILLHGNNARTAEATERLCEILYNDGYRFCTVDELFKFKGVDYNTLPSNAMLYGIDPETGEIITKNKY